MIATVTISGKVVRPNGQGVDGGSITIELSESGTVDDSGTEQVVGGSFIEKIATNGDVNFTIIPNSGTGSISPPGTTYLAVIEDSDGRRWSKVWSIAASPSSQDIGDL